MVSIDATISPPRSPPFLLRRVRAIFISHPETFLEVPQRALESGLVPQDVTRQGTGRRRIVPVFAHSRMTINLPLATGLVLVLRIIRVPFLSKRHGLCGAIGLFKHRIPLLGLVVAFAQSLQAKTGSCTDLRNWTNHFRLLCDILWIRHDLEPFFQIKLVGLWRGNQPNFWFPKLSAYVFRQVNQLTTQPKWLGAFGTRTHPVNLNGGFLQLDHAYADQILCTIFHCNDKIRRQHELNSNSPSTEL